MVHDIDQMSEACVQAFFFKRTSGAMYLGLPTATPLAVCVLFSNKCNSLTLAKPKSHTLTFLLRLTRILSGLTSLWKFVTDVDVKK